MKVVAYYRVSTRKQGQSGLGLESQKAIVARFVGNSNNSRAKDDEPNEIIAEFTEIETGKNNQRPQLAAAIALCKKTGATLVIAKLDRLARNVLFTASLMESGVEFIACDLPTANRLMIHIMAALAEEEARLISERTKAALAAAKARGTLLGGARGPTNTFTKNIERRQSQKATRLQESYGDILPLVTALKEREVNDAEIADTLNRQGFRTPTGKEFRASTIYQLCQRLEAVA